MSRRITDYLEYSGEENRNSNTVGQAISRGTDIAHAAQNMMIANRQEEKQKADTAKRYGLSEKDDIDAFLKANYQDEESKEYLVDGALLTCTNCINADIGIKVDGEELVYKVQENMKNVAPSIIELDSSKVYGRLVVTENEDADIEGAKYATIADSIAEKNIPYFGNCKRLPHNEAELEKFREIHKKENKGKTIRDEGSCKQLMNLEREWENYISVESLFAFSDDQKGDKAGITMTSMLFCKHGGFIYPVTSGQTMSLTTEQAMAILRNYLKEGLVSEELVEKALLFLASQSSYQLKEYKSGLGYDYNIYDSLILGWTEYYNAGSDIKINPEYIKSMCFRESTLGYGSNKVPTTNVQRDIMQALDVKNYNIYLYIAIALEQFEAMTSDGIPLSGLELWKLNWDEDAPKPGDCDEAKQGRCGGIISTLFTENEDGTGEHYHEGSNATYYYQHQAVTPAMSVGVGMDKMRELLDENNGDYKKALEAYNGSDQKEAYAKEIMERAEAEGDVICPEE